MTHALRLMCICIYINLWFTEIKNGNFICLNEKWNLATKIISHLYDLQVLTQKVEQATKSRIGIINKLKKANDEIEDLKFQVTLTIILHIKKHCKLCLIHVNFVIEFLVGRAQHRIGRDACAVACSRIQTPQ